MEYLIIYLSLGIICLLLILSYPDQYTLYLKDAVTVIKISSIKMNKKPEEKIAPKVEQYQKDLDVRLAEDSIEIQKNPARYNFVIFYTIVLWPMIFFIFILAALLYVFYLEKSDF